MGRKKPGDATRAFEQALVNDASTERYVLRLYITGMTPRSVEAIETIRKICEEHLQGRYDLEVIDIYQRPELAKDEQIIAVPTLVKKLPAPLRRFIGNSLRDLDAPEISGRSSISLGRKPRQSN